MIVAAPVLRRAGKRLVEDAALVLLQLERLIQRLVSQQQEQRELQSLRLERSQRQRIEEWAKSQASNRATAPSRARLESGAAHSFARLHLAT